MVTALVSLGQFAIALVALAFVAVQLTANAKLAQQTYLQERGQDFLKHEYESPEVLGCVYDWWYPAEDSESEDPNLLHRCEAVRGLNSGTDSGPTSQPTQAYAETMLYIEESLMYFVEESRMTCEYGVEYGRELAIWRNDVSEDVSGAFSYYMLYRFAAPSMIVYFSGTPLIPSEADIASNSRSTPDAALRLTQFVRMAKIPDLSLAEICENARRFKQSLNFPIEVPPHVAEICDAQNNTRSESLYTPNNDPNYCVRIHGIPPWYARLNPFAAR